MESYLRVGLLVVAVVIMFLILIESAVRRRRLKAMEQAPFTMDFSEPIIEKSEPVLSIEEPVVPVKKSFVKVEPYIMALSVFAKENGSFGSYDLLQSISATGMQFGEMNIFHYHMDGTSNSELLFSLASATKPGFFDLDKIGDFSCRGLTLFMGLANVTDPTFAFSKMLLVAEQLADDLDGELRASPHQPWNEETLHQYQERLESYRELAD